ncbi:Gfo/Idh/MocA family protein [Elioraea sp.]|uniref:Gfo/Idh/MocA family protein n=1 Tax=Elioraea sp. TaxID=2185103 RepID=UPI003F703C56
MTLAVGLIGAGYFAQFHAEAWARMPGARLAGVCDSDRAKAEATAARHGGVAFGDLAAMLAEIPLDLLDIAAPPPVHAPAIRAAIAAGVPTAICQKPFCGELGAAEAITAEAEAAGLRLIVHENFRFQPWYREIARLLADGAIGEPLHLTFRLRPGDGQGPRAYLDRQPYFQQMPRFLVHETAVHLLDVFRFLWGEPEAVFADLRRLNPAIAGEDAGLVILRYGNGRRALFDGNRLVDHAAANPRLTMGEMLAEGTAGTIRLDGAGRLWQRRQGVVDECEHAHHLPPQGYGGDCVFALQRHVVAHLTDATAVENIAREYLATLRLVEACYASAEEGRWIAL